MASPDGVCQPSADMIRLVGWRTGERRGVGVAARGRSRWGLFAVIAALPALVVVWLVVLVVKFATSDYPLGTVQAWMDTDYEATFRMPRAGVRDWLTGTYPKGPAPGTELCAEGADLCLNLNTDEYEPPAGVDANAVVVNVTYEGPDTALVKFSAFTV